MNLSRRRYVATLLASAVAASVLAPSPAADATVPACSAGLVALTFDDGPAAGVTPRLLTTLRQWRVPATFFMVGARVHTDPTDARLVAQGGYVVGNHTWSHTALTLLHNADIRSELARTRAELRRAGVTPSRLVRPPYGATDARVNGVIRGLGLVPVLWTVDSRDWQSGTPRDLTARVLGQLRPHATNIVLQHDGVRRSPISIQAVPAIVRQARARGYCFAALGDDGRPAAPVPVLRASITAGREHGRVPVHVVMTLDRPTSRPVSVRVTTVSGTATSGADFVPLAHTFVFPVGTTQLAFDVRVVDDHAFEPTETLRLRFGAANGLRPAAAERDAAILSDDAKPPPPPPPPTPTPTPTPTPPPSP